MPLVLSFNSDRRTNEHGGDTKGRVRFAVEFVKVVKENTRIALSYQSSSFLEVRPWAVVEKSS